MVRGGYGSGSGIPLSDRVRAGAASPAKPPAAPDSGRASDAVEGACPARHCWVSVPLDGPQARPGLLLEWRQGERGRWEGRVIYVAQLRAGRWSLVEEWVPAELLTPS